MRPKNIETQVIEENIEDCLNLSAVLVSYDDIQKQAGKKRDGSNPFGEGTSAGIVCENVEIVGSKLINRPTSEESSSVDPWVKHLHYP